MLRWGSREQENKKNENNKNKIYEGRRDQNKSSVLFFVSFSVTSSSSSTSFLYLHKPHLNPFLCVLLVYVDIHAHVHKQGMETSWQKQK